jgi:deoxyribodipyrimidine photo-lyase
VKARSAATGVFPPSNGARVFLSELGWREFAHHLLFHFPDTPERPFRGDFARFAWAEDPGGAMLHAWQRGLTGYPIVDAGMRQLWRTGWMHNRVRMIVASFLVKHLRLPWPAGAAWFWDTLVDADLANNTLGWQWSAGCGADAAPYFRVFAPVLQGQKFDPEGAYVRRWVPELAPVPTEYLHAPWEAPPLVLLAAGVRLGGTYPHPVVDHVQARHAALAAFKRLRGGEMAPGTGGRPGPQL